MESKFQFLHVLAAVSILLFCVTYAAAAPPHDECANAIAVTLDVTYYGSNSGATGVTTSSCVGGDLNDVWHSFTPASSGSYKISLCGSSFDTTLAVHDGCGGSELGCNDDACDYQSEISIDLTGGQTYLIRVAGYSGESGSYELLVTSEVCNVPSEPNMPNPVDGEKDSAIDTILSWNGSVPITLDMHRSITPKIIYGDDDRMDEYQVSNSAHLNAGDATVAILSSGDVTYNGDGTFTLSDQTFAEYMSASGTPLCPDEPYRDQPNPAFCSGFLVGPDIIATAGHCITGSSDCSDSVFVFGFVMEDAATARVIIDESQVYYCSEIIQRQYTGTSDWAMIRLDRAVTDHIPLNVDRNGSISNGDDVLVIGHPMGLPRKYAAGATVQDNGPSEYFQANVDTYGGNSGSAVFDANMLDVAGILVRGNEDFVLDGSCYRSNVCPDTGCPDWQEVTRSTEFADLIPSWDVYLQTSGGIESLVCSDTVVQWCDPGPLQCGMTYNWRVVAKNNCGQVQGGQWLFTTQPTGDFDNDCNVDAGDFAGFGKEWLSTGCTPANSWCNGSDLSQDGLVNIVDLQEWVSHWMDSVP